MKDFKFLPSNSLKKLKRSVKAFLQSEMGSDFYKCLFVVEDQTFHTYGIPKHLEAKFKTWATSELKKSFPQYQNIEV